MLEVVEPGLLSSVQDGGRPGAVGLGVPEGGACDRWSLGVANALVGNAPAAPALELTLVGPALRVRADCLVGLAGADLEARIEPGVGLGSRLQPGRSHLLRAGQTLAFEAAGEHAGIRAYLALAGGIDVPDVLGSASACLLGGFPGLTGRALAAGDVLRPREADPLGRALHWPGDFVPAREATRRALRVMRGPHAERVPANAFARLLGSEYRISPRGDRQGVVVEGPILAGAAAGAEMLSQGVPWGAIQLPPDGRPICLLADHGTVGGYPVVAVVISADLPLLGQLGPGDPVAFREVSRDEALAALRGQHAEWQACLRSLGKADA